MTTKSTPEATFKKYVHKTSTCWNWTGYINKSGYGQLTIARFFQGQKAWRAHRLSYILYKGPIPQGLFVCHKCDNRVCVNPDHLWLGTNRDNMQDAKAKGRLKRYKITKCPHCLKDIDNKKPHF